MAYLYVKAYLPTYDRPISDLWAIRRRVPSTGRVSRSVKCTVYGCLVCQRVDSESSSVT